MAIEVLSWNLYDGLSNPAKVDGILGAIKEVGPTVAVLPEAYDEYRKDSLTFEGALEEIERMGYVPVAALNDDEEYREDRHGSVAMIKREHYLSAFSQGAVELTGRNALQVSVEDPESGNPISVYGVHLDDREENTRIVEVQQLIANVEQTRSEQTVLAGDFNALHFRDTMSIALRLVKPLFAGAEFISYRPGGEYPFFAEKKDKIRRLSSMATGQTLERLIWNGFSDADRKHTPTFPVLGPLAVNVDHILYKGNIWPVTDSFTAHPKTDLTDHRAVSVGFYTYKQ